MAKLKLIVVSMVITLLSFNTARAVEVDNVNLKIIPDKTSETMKIDAELTEEVWKNKEISEEFISFVPVYGEILEQKTKVWAAYDSRNLYFAFKCFDSEPGKIKATIAQRDRIFREDWVGVMIDAVGNKQNSFEFYVNPNGIQGDALNSSASGTDIHPDFVWQSAGKITDFGYQVEICIPVNSLSFKSGKEVRMGILLVRQISRLGMAISWPTVKAGQTDFNSMATAVYQELKSGLKLELLPDFVYSSNKERSNNNDWEKNDVSKEFGVAVKYGITSSITSEVTVNPDFSQVESDAFQVEVNRRYPIFNFEKRPFFMEGQKTFDFGLTEYNHLQFGMLGAAIHTRRIVDPGWAAKVSGSMGKVNFGFLAADDRSPNQTWGSLADSSPNKNAYWGIARAKYNLGSDNSIGLLYSGSFFADNSNNTVGTDIQYRVSQNLRLFVNYLRTETKLSPETDNKIGNGLNALAQYISPKLDAWALYERYDENFQMNSAFIDRIGISRGKLFIGPNFYTHIKGLDWIKRIQPWILLKQLRDLGTHMDDSTWAAGVNVYFYGLGVAELSYHNEKEAWQGQNFTQKYVHFWLYGQLLKWLQTQIFFWVGDQIYYDSVDPFMGIGPRGIVEVTLEPIQKLRINPEWLFNYFSRKSNHEKVYFVNVFNVTLTYQFNRYFFLRGALRYDDYEKKLLTDLLASFTLVPGTVLHLGYGSLYENKIWQGNQWITGTGHLLNMKNSLFLKLSYLWRIK